MRSASGLSRSAFVFLSLHAIFSIFSAIAFATFLSGASPEWLQSPSSQRALVIGWRFAPAVTVILGALAALLYCAEKFGARRAGLLFAVAFVVSLAAELTGTSTGFPFGPYSYSPILGYRVGGLVPFSIPTSWFYMLYASVAMSALLLRDRIGAGKSEGKKWRVAALAGVILTAWDVSMDPAMVKTNHWMWHLPPNPTSLFGRMLLTDAFYGMPLLNWTGWLITGTFVARLMLAVVPVAEWLGHVSRSRFPLLLYAVNGVLPITICARYGLTWAAVFGFIAMVIPLLAAGSSMKSNVAVETGRSSTVIPVNS